jgi:polyisoprenyl-phosphate glycosyltransferase
MNKTSKDIVVSVVIPVYNEESNILPMMAELESILEGQLAVRYEVIFVDDGSNDTTWSTIEGLNKKNRNVKGLRLSRNFGHQSALKAGLDFSKGDVVISIDGDLQHPPDLIPSLIEEWQRGFEIVRALRKDTKGVNFLKELSSRMYYRLLNAISGMNLQEGSSDYRLLDRKVVEELKDISEHQLFIRGLVDWMGFKSTSVSYVANQRYSGKAKYSFKKMVKFAFDGVMSFSVTPLRLALVCGLTVTFLDFIYIVYALCAHFFLNMALPGWTSILVSVLFLGGIQLLSIGLLGEYLGRLFIQAKGRKNYILTQVLDD